MDLGPWWNLQTNSTTDLSQGSVVHPDQAGYKIICKLGSGSGINSGYPDLDPALNPDPS